MFISKLIVDWGLYTIHMLYEDVNQISFIISDSTQIYVAKDGELYAWGKGKFYKHVNV